MYFHVVTEISVYTLSGMVHTVNIIICMPHHASCSHFQEVLKTMENNVIICLDAKK